MISKEKVIQEQVIKFLSPNIQRILLKKNKIIFSNFQEIRIRAKKPLIIQDGKNDWFIDEYGNIINDSKVAYKPNRSDVMETLNIMSENSLYAFSEEIKNGFITLKGGHRVGIVGRVIIEENKIKNITDISGLNIRISKEIIGCSDSVLKYILNNKNSIYNTLFISPPQCGKTTLLRDISRTLSNGTKTIKGFKIGIVDERSEIASCYKGIPQNDVGIRTDVLDNCPKSLGMLMLLRSMSPDVIITDEIGNEGDKNSVMQLVNSGVKIITSSHGYNISQLKSRNEIIKLIENKVFERIIVLSNACGPGTIEEVMDGINNSILFKRVKNYAS